MMFTKKVARQLKRYCGADCRVCRAGFYGEEVEANPDEGYNMLFVEADADFDIVDSDEPDYLVGTDIPEVEGYVLFDVYVYYRDGGLSGNREALFDRNGDMIWRGDHPHSWREVRPANKVGLVVAEYFGLKGGA